MNSSWQKPLTVMGGGIAPLAILKHIDRHAKNQEPQTQIGGGIAPLTVLKHIKRHTKEQKDQLNKGR